MSALRLVPAVILLVSTGVSAQVSHEIEREYNRRVRAADADSSSAEDRYLAAEAARYMRRYDEARHYLRAAEFAVRDASDRNGILNQRLWLELATGGGVEGVQRVFAQARKDVDSPPTVIAGWVNSFPELLVGGRLDTLIDRLSADAADPRYRCACYAPKAWMHRAAGRMELSRLYWDSLIVSWQREPDFGTPFVEADWRAQLARNHARAGHADRAREELQRAIAVDVSAFESVFIRRRRAQAYAELGDVDRLIEDLEFLLANPSPVTVHTLRARLTWSAVRETPEFKALLERAEARRR